MSRQGTFNINNYDYVVGIDFGTTYSGCSWSSCGSKKDAQIVDVTSWPGHDSDHYPKTPTALIYDSSGKHKYWGKKAEKEKLKLSDKENKFYSLFKLYLHQPNAINLPPGFSSVKLISEYLECLHSYVYKVMESKISNLNRKRLRYCLTVPAIWDDQAKASMREAAIRARIIDRDDHPLRLMLISEPEAAAIYCEKRMKEFQLSDKQRFMVCDAGGGTVDLIIFELNKDEDGNRTLHEVTSSSGDAYGSSFVDKNMLNLIKEKLASEGELSRKRLNIIMDTFTIEQKTVFGEGKKDIYITLPSKLRKDKKSIKDNKNLGIKDGKLLVTYDELRTRVFDPVVEKILGLIREQLEQNDQEEKLNGLLLVGGFGRNKYLMDRISEVFQNEINVIKQVPRGELAISRGAVCFGLSPTLISERISKRSYGIMAALPFNPLLDSKSHVVINNGIPYCARRFSIFVKKGQMLKNNEYMFKKYTVKYPNNTDADLYAYNGNGDPPRSITDPRVYKVAKFPIKMPHFPDMAKGDKVEMFIHMFFGQTEIRVEAKIRHYKFTFTSTFESAEKFKVGRSLTPKK